MLSPLLSQQTNRLIVFSLNWLLKSKSPLVREANVAMYVGPRREFNGDCSRQEFGIVY